MHGQRVFVASKARKRVESQVRHLKEVPKKEQEVHPVLFWLQLRQVTF